VVELYSEWCGPCQSVLPTFKRLRMEKDEEAYLKFLKVPLPMMYPGSRRNWRSAHDVVAQDWCAQLHWCSAFDRLQVAGSWGLVPSPHQQLSGASRGMRSAGASSTTPGALRASFSHVQSAVLRPSTSCHACGGMLHAIPEPGTCATIAQLCAGCIKRGTWALHVMMMLHSHCKRIAHVTMDLMCGTIASWSRSAAFDQHQSPSL
jgi:hypothetical protein